MLALIHLSSHPVVEASQLPSNLLRFKTCSSRFCRRTSQYARGRWVRGATKIVMLQARHHYSPLVMVGDGATDLEAKQEGGADLFIG